MRTYRFVYSSHFNYKVDKMFYSFNFILVQPQTIKLVINLKNIVNITK